MAERDVVEIWKPVTVRDGYEASNLGNIRSVPRWITSTTGQRYYSKGKILKKQKGPNGYPVVNLGAKFMTRYVHHLVMHAFFGPTPSGKEILHNNDIKTDCSISNLRFGTRKDNHADQVRNGKLSGWRNYAELLLSQHTKIKGRKFINANDSQKPAGSGAVRARNGRRDHGE
jgi:hypothetical protein